MGPEIMPQLGRETVIDALGKRWTVGRWTVDVWDQLLEWARPRLPDPFAGLEKVVDKLPEAAALQLVREAQERAARALSIQSPEVVELIDGTLEGKVQTFYLLLRQHHPDVTREEVVEVLRAIGEDQERRAKERAAGEAPSSGNP